MITLNILPIPYPYKAMLSLTNDIDQCSWSKFQLLHQFFNTDNDTSIGKGINIEIGNSFWFFQNPDADEYAFSYFRNLSQQKSEYYQEIIDLNKRGYLDCLHTWGNFSKVGGFKRKYAEKATEESIKYSIKCPVWINHGDSHNSQNLVYGSGDDPDSEFYSADLLPYLNTTFVWLNDITKFIGQDRRFNIDEVYFDNNSSTVYKIKTYSKLICKLILLRHIFLPTANSLIRPVILRDNQKLLKFTRYGFWNKATLSDLPEILSEQIIEKLLLSKGKMCVYIHLGKNCTWEILKKVVPVYNKISELYHRQHLLVCTTSRLLNFALAAKELRTDIKIHDSKYIINLTFPSIKGEQNNNNLLNGLSFIVSSRKRFILLFNNKEVPFHQKYDPSLKKWILYSPWKRIS
ncbi:MAG TPA: hypothetical protein ENN33_08340 [Ignavibacteria bacterium]|nr:hypothetical protein [Ignavibacteria bacterium]